jgi:hypothetical protein
MPSSTSKDPFVDFKSLNESGSENCSVLDFGKLGVSSVYELTVFRAEETVMFRGAARSFSCQTAIRNCNNSKRDKIQSKQKGRTVVSPQYCEPVVMTDVVSAAKAIYAITINSSNRESLNVIENKKHKNERREIQS